VRNRHDRVLAACLSSALYASATADKAWCNIGGSVLPRFSARRRIPRQARALKKYRCGTPPVSKISDNDDTPPSLRDSPSKPVHSHELSVKHSVCEPKPEFRHPPEKGSKRPSSVDRQRTGDVLPNEPSGTVAICDSKISESEVSPRVSQPLAKSRDGERLAGGAPNEKIESCIGPLLKPRHVSKIRYVWVVMGEHRTREWLDFREER
tara:strand:+ start:851 stop:1474 length:624 start_codon:yes stop_codon:yes gene_type:complete